MAPGSISAIQMPHAFNIPSPVTDSIYPAWKQVKQSPCNISTAQQKEDKF